MTPPRRPRIPTNVDGLEWVITDDGSRTLWNTQLEETFHSGCGAVAESLIVYLKHSGVAARLRAQATPSLPTETPAGQRAQPTRILEYGFGTGTAFLLTAACAELCKARIEYVGIERSLLPSELFAQLALADSAERYFSRPPDADRPIEFELAPYTTDQFLKAVQQIETRFVDWRKSLDPIHTDASVPSTKSVALSPHVELSLILGDARQLQLTDAPPCKTGEADALEGFDAVYFDPFSPESNPELWTEAVFRSLYRRLANGGTLTSYCVKGDVRRRLASVGFEVSRLPGPVGGKREVLVARKSNPIAETH